MKDLFIIETVKGQQTINARQLWKFLGSQKQYADWIKNRLQDFDEGIDFISFSLKSEKPLGGRPSIEYYITPYTAEHIAMVERNDKGKEVRNFFRKKRDEANLQVNPFLNMSKKELLLNAIEYEEKIEKQQKIITKQDTAIQQISNTQYSYSIRETAGKLLVKEIELKNYLKNKKWIQYLSDGEEGKKVYATSYSKENNFGINKTVLNKEKNQYYHQFRITSHGLDYLIKRREEVLN